MPAAALDVRWISLCADVPAPFFDRDLEFWSQVSGWPAGDPAGDRAPSTPVQPIEGTTYLRLQRTDDDAGGWHLDLSVPDLEVATAGAAERGAAVVRATSGLVTMTTPAGQPFCLTASAGSPTRPAATRWPGGQRSLVDQVCLDLPAADYDRDADFWAEVAGWPRTDAKLPEFERLRVPDQLPVKVLLQRLGPDDAHVRAHADLACDDRATEVERHVGLGASVAGDFAHWTSMRDPAGLSYCITDRQPQ
ncbi:VOC family protein [uncultured Jatrophihabitans sp.]|uniref:VOC family protein n=1 Tax=uncultured Jatrophihabitans sp. TaxID=1610747 RepID=UPI0035C977DF